MSESGALPYTTLLILLELALGGMLVMQYVDLRGQATRGFIKATVIFVPILLALALWVALGLDGETVEGFAVDAGARTALVWLLGAMTGLSVAHNALILLDREREGLLAGLVLTAASLAALALASVMLEGAPVWLVALSLAAGSLAVGLAAVGLALGHWYLVTPRLPAQPLVELTAALLIVIVVQVALFGGAMAVSVTAPEGGRSVPLAEDPTFWLRIVVGFALPLLFGWMAWQSARIRSMMAATGLLYLATAAVLAAEIAARALMLDSARPL